MNYGHSTLSMFLMQHLVCLGTSNVPGKTNKFVNLKSLLELLLKLIWNTVEDELVVRNRIALNSIYYKAEYSPVDRFCIYMMLLHATIPTLMKSIDE